MKKNEVYKLSALGYGTEGEGVCRADCTVFVPNLMEGEEALVKILSVKGNVAYGKVEELISPSPCRVRPVCPVFLKCGGCQLQHMDYNSQLMFKRGQVKGTLSKVGGIDSDVQPTVPSARPLRYRNKLVLPVGAEGVGFYSARSHRIVPVDDCPIQAGWCVPVIAAVKRFMQTAKIDGYDEVTRRGTLRRVAVREVGGRYIVVLVCANNIDARPLVPILRKELNGEFTLLVNINAGTGNAVFGGEWHTVYGDGFFVAEDMGIKFRAGANTFMQVNEGVRQSLYADVAAEAADGGAVAIDLYSGGGMLTALLATRCRAAYGVEVVPEASACADELAALNGLSGRMFNICGRVEDELPSVFARTKGKRRVIVCDPPRKGMERSVVRAVRESGADKIILISCNPATLARDLGLLLGSLKEEGGELKKDPDYAATSVYNIDYIRPYDMFPQTKWAETIVCLTLKK